MMNRNKKRCAFQPSVARHGLKSGWFFPAQPRPRLRRRRHRHRFTHRPLAPQGPGRQ